MRNWWLNNSARVTSPAVINFDSNSAESLEAVQASKRGEDEVAEKLTVAYSSLGEESFNRMLPTISSSAFSGFCWSF